MSDNWYTNYLLGRILAGKPNKKSLSYRIINGVCKFIVISVMVLVVLGVILAK